MWSALRFILSPLIKLFLVCVVLSLVVIVAIPFLLPQEFVRNTISAAYREATGRTLVLDGDVGISFFPSSSLSVTKAVFNTGEKDQRTISDVTLKFEFWQLVQDRLNFSMTAKLDTIPVHIRGDIPNLKTLRTGGKMPVNIQVLAPKPITFTADFDLGESHTLLDNIVLVLPKSSLSGFVHLDQRTGRKTLKADVKAPVVSVDEITELNTTFKEIISVVLSTMPLSQQALVPDSASEEVKDIPHRVENTNKFSWPSNPLPFTQLAQWDMDVYLHVGRLTHSGIDYGTGRYTLVSDGNRLTSSLMDSTFFNGDVQMKTVLELTADPVKLENNLVTKGIDIGKMLQVLAKFERLKGGGSISASLTAQGNTLEEMIHNLNGAGNLSLQDGVLVGANIQQMATTNVKQFVSAFTQEGSTTDILESQASFNIENGVLTNDDLLVKIPFQQLTGKGVVRLTDLIMDYTVTPKVGVEKIGVQAPVIIFGDVRSPQYKIDLKGLVIENLDKVKILKNKEVQKVLGKIKGAGGLPPGVVENLGDALLGAGRGAQLNKALLDNNATKQEEVDTISSPNVALPEADLPQNVNKIEPVQAIVNQLEGQVSPEVQPLLQLAPMLLQQHKKRKEQKRQQRQNDIKSDPPPEPLSNLMISPKQSEGDRQPDRGGGKMMVGSGAPVVKIPPIIAPIEKSYYSRQGAKKVHESGEMILALPPQKTMVIEVDPKERESSSPISGSQPKRIAAYAEMSALAVDTDSYQSLSSEKLAKQSSSQRSSSSHPKSVPSIGNNASKISLKRTQRRAVEKIDMSYRSGGSEKGKYQHPPLKGTLLGRAKHSILLQQEQEKSNVLAKKRDLANNKKLQLSVRPEVKNVDWVKNTPHIEQGIVNSNGKNILKSSIKNSYAIEHPISEKGSSITSLPSAKALDSEEKMVAKKTITEVMLPVRLYPLYNLEDDKKITVIYDKVAASVHDVADLKEVSQLSDISPSSGTSSGPPYSVSSSASVVQGEAIGIVPEEEWLGQGYYEYMSSSSVQPTVPAKALNPNIDW